MHSLLELILIPQNCLQLSCQESVAFIFVEQEQDEFCNWSQFKQIQ